MRRLRPKHENGFRINLTFRQQHEPAEPNGDWMRDMADDANAAYFNKLSYIKRVREVKDLTRDTKLHWNRMTWDLCTSPKCTLHFCHCGARSPHKVDIKILSAYLDKVENIQWPLDSAVEI